MRRSVWKQNIVTMRVLFVLPSFLLFLVKHAENYNPLPSSSAKHNLRACTSSPNGVGNFWGKQRDHSMASGGYPSSHVSNHLQDFTPRDQRRRTSFSATGGADPNNNSPLSHKNRMIGGEKEEGAADDESRVSSIPRLRHPGLRVASRSRILSPEPRTPLVSPASLASSAIPATPQPRSPSRGVLFSQRNPSLPRQHSRSPRPRSVILQRSSSIRRTSKLDNAVAPHSPLQRTGDEYDRRRDVYIGRIYKEVNTNVFNGKLPNDLEITWNFRFHSTAGITRYEKVLRSGEVGLRVRIELSSKLLNHIDRLKSTLVHELCHVATYLLSGDLARKEPMHGSTFKRWATLAKEQYPELQLQNCHKYDSAKPRKASGFSQFVKANFGAFKAKCATNATHSEIMRQLGKAWAKAKGGLRAKSSLRRLEKAFAAPGSKNMEEDEWIQKMMSAMQLTV